MFSIDGLDLANGVKEMLVNNGFTLDTLLKISPAELAIILGIDLYVAKLIYHAAKRHETDYNENIKDRWQYENAQTQLESV